MKGWKTSIRAPLVLNLLDAPFILVAGFGVSSALGVEVMVGMVPWLGLSALRVLAVMGAGVKWLGVVDRWERSEGEPRDRALSAANAALVHGPMSIAVVYGVGWILSLDGAGLLLYLFAPERAPTGLPDLLSLSFLGLAGLFGGVSFAGPILDLVVRSQRIAASRELADSGAEPGRERLSLGQQLALYMCCFVVAAAALIASPSWANHVAFERYKLATQLGRALEQEATTLAQGGELERGRVVDAVELPPVMERSAVLDELPELDARVTLERRRGRMSVARELEDGRWLLVEGDRSEVSDGYGMAFLVFVTLMLLWAPLTIILLIRSLVAPLRALELFLRRLTKVGDISALEHLPVIQYNEIGFLTRGVNELVERLQALAGAAVAVSAGELRVDIDAHGELGESFLAMVEQLDEIVTEIRVTAVAVGSVSAEIYAAAQRQEEAAGRSATTVTEVNATVRSLADAAERITGSADEVLGAAERGSQTADVMVARIDALTALAGGISDLVEQIRDIADRSDLLALNGSLEATRAGEAGRGFALVAAEMRRLAERVTATVASVRARIAQIESSGASAKTASADTREISTQTASLAEDIAQQTRRQRDETEVASAAIESMAAFVTEASVSTSQTRAAAGSLRGRVDELERLVRQFNTRETPFLEDDQRQ